MAKKRLGVEQIIGKLREAIALLNSGNDMGVPGTNNISRSIYKSETAEMNGDWYSSFQRYFQQALNLIRETNAS